MQEYYNNDELKFEGEHLNGERNEKGKEYDEISNLKYEGEYIKGQRWNGKGKGNYSIFYNPNPGMIEYEYVNGQVINSEHQSNIVNKEININQEKKTNLLSSSF